MIDFFSNLDKFMKYKGLNDNKITIEANISNGIIGKGRKRGALSQDNISKILHTYPELNANWLLIGEGKMLKNQDSQQKLTPIKNGIPLIPLDAMAGFGEGDMQVMKYDTDLYVVPEFDQLHVDFMIRVKGSSMYPKYNSGDVVACRKLPLDTFFQWNKVYVIDTIQGPMIKRIHKSEIDASILCVSDNIKYEPFDLPLEDLYSLAIVVGVIRLE